MQKDKLAIDMQNENVIHTDSLSFTSVNELYFPLQKLFAW